MENYRLSKWEFITSAGLDLGFGVAVASGGMVSLKDPENKSHQFHYGGFGVGWSRGFALTRIEMPEGLVQNYLPSGSGSITSFPSKGVVYMTGAFKGKELTQADICGVTVYVELGIGAIAGYGVMFLGLNQLLVLAGEVMPPLHLIKLAIAEAPAILVMRGANIGPSVSLGVNGLLGFLH